MLACGNLLNYFVAFPFRDKENNLACKSLSKVTNDTSSGKIHTWRKGSIIPSNFINFNSFLKSKTIFLIHIYKGLLSSFCWVANPWHLAILLTCFYSHSIMSWAIIGNAFSKDGFGMTTWIVSLAFSNGYSKCWPYSKVSNYCLGLKTSKAHILSFLLWLMLCSVDETNHYLSVWGVNIIFSLLHLSISIHLMLFSSWVHLGICYIAWARSLSISSS